jgi:hypothetical protein
VVADALRRKSYANMAVAETIRVELCKEFEHLNLGFINNMDGFTMEVEPTLQQDIRKGQLEDEKIKEIKELTKVGKAPGFGVDDQGTLWLKERICVPDLKPLRDTILREAHESAYSIHPGSTKMFEDLKTLY